MRVLHGLFPKAVECPCLNGKLLMIVIIGDEHHRDGGVGGVGFESLEDFDSIAVIDIEFAIDQDELWHSVREESERILELIGLRELYIEPLAEGGLDRTVIVTTIADVEDQIFHDGFGGGD